MVMMVMTMVCAWEGEGEHGDGGGVCVEGVVEEGMEGACT